MKSNFYILLIMIFNIHTNYVYSDIFNFDEIARFKSHCGGNTVFIKKL